MPQEYRLIHHFVVKELPYTGRPLSPKIISDRLATSLDQVNNILDNLEKRLTFLYRNKQGEVIWSYPVTVEKTPHQIIFNTGEKLYAAGAADAFATPFVQGQLRNEYLSVTIKTECAHGSQPMELEIDSDLNYQTKQQACEPIVFVPDVDFSQVKDESIIDSFGTECVFFWSGEDAKAYRKSTHRVRAAYFNA